MRQKRIKAIEGILMQNEFVSLDDLCDRFGVSKMTIRRDVAQLVGLGIAKKVYGGVIASPKQEHLVSFFARSEFQTEEKLAIGRRAAAMVKEGDIIYIDAGSTTAAMVTFLESDRRITVITHNLGVVHEIAAKRGLRLIVVGGEFLPETYSTVGIEAIEAIRKLNAHTAFLGASGISLAKGVTNSSSIEAEIKRAILQVAERRVLLADWQKFDRASLVTFCTFADIETLVTDRPPPEAYASALAAEGVEVVIAAPPTGSGGDFISSGGRSAD